jgi:hypothetical protein
MTAKPSGGVEAPPSQGDSPCAIASAAAVTAAFGGKVAAVTTSTTGTGSPLCRFVLDNSRVGASLTVSVSTHRPVSASSFNDGKALALKSGATAVSGVGDSAYYTQSAATLQFIRGTTGGFVAGTLPHGTGSARTAAAMRSGTVALGTSITSHL